MYKPFTARIVGIAPLLQHNVQLSDPLNEWSKLISATSKKRNKTDDDMEKLSQLEWRGSVYANGERIVLPGQNVKASIREAAKTRKLGTHVKRGVLMTEDFPLEFSGSGASLEAMAADPAMRERKSMKVGTSRVMRTFPKFTDWSVNVAGLYHSETMDADQVETLLELAGMIAGIGDLRPVYGRFQVANFETE